MYPSFFSTLAATPAVTAIFGSSPTIRIYPHGEAPQGVVLPYAVHQLVTGSPENYLATSADMDTYRIQFDVYADNPTPARNGASAIRTALESSAYLVSFNGDGRDPDTNHSRYSFDMEFMADRTGSVGFETPASEWSTPTLLNSWVDIGGTSQPTQYRRVGDRVDVRLVVRGGTGLNIFVLPEGSRPPYEIGFNANVHDNTDAPDYGHIRVFQNGTVQLEHHGSLNNHKVWATFSFFISY